MATIFLNSEFLPSEEAKVSVFDRSYLFGEGLFETFRSINGKIPLLMAHINRLEWSCSVLGLHFPAHVNFQEVCEELLKKNELKDARYKILLSRTGIAPSSQIKASLESSALGEHCSNQNLLDANNTAYDQNLCIFCEPYHEDRIPKTYHLAIVKNIMNDAPPIATLKTTNYLTKLLARSEAHDAGYDDGILINTKGFVTETTTANIFWLDKDNKLWTTMEDQGVLPGVMKKHLIHIMKKNEISFKEGLITPKDLTNTREVFITNSVIGLRPVTKIDNRQISGGEIGSVSDMLKRLLEQDMGIKK